VSEAKSLLKKLESLFQDSDMSPDAEVECASIMEKLKFALAFAMHLEKPERPDTGMTNPYKRTESVVLEEVSKKVPRGRRVQDAQVLSTTAETKSKIKRGDRVTKINNSTKAAAANLAEQSDSETKERKENKTNASNKGNKKKSAEAVVPLMPKRGRPVSSNHDAANPQPSVSAKKYH